MKILNKITEVSKNLLKKAQNFHIKFMILRILENYFEKFFKIFLRASKIIASQLS